MKQLVNFRAFPSSKIKPRFANSRGSRMMKSALPGTLLAVTCSIARSLARANACR
ncbi:hypothetical protein G4G28_04490 [Massilia sp. Dwa41.01b]|uniref:hypothetical protein n=1 Tax=unclassified Massilia TaxID=2609279 RepID=UPI0015FF76BF|nr:MULTISPECIES: hypothetical protein [unclassified Massilia]QNA87909.1 hypothetical protein G4G28_04490 [Massilia sp. Dwa41.01b]QNA98812.1 hypothetical protein G4G31_08210 [Massilia sp. Se16.2.3]